MAQESTYRQTFIKRNNIKNIIVINTGNRVSYGLISWWLMQLISTENIVFIG